jgi:hypothetical protein
MHATFGCKPILTCNFLFPCNFWRADFFPSNLYACSFFSSNFAGLQPLELLNQPKSLFDAERDGIRGRVVLMFRQRYFNALLKNFKIHDPLIW